MAAGATLRWMLADGVHGRCFHRDPSGELKGACASRPGRWRGVEPRLWDRGANMTTAGAAGAAGTVGGGDVNGLGK